MIDLKEVITKYPECLENADRLKAYLFDLYPDDTVEATIVSSILLCGIADEIKTVSDIDDLLISQFCDRLERRYGYSMRLSKECVSIWCEAYGKNETILESSKVLKISGNKNWRETRKTAEERFAAEKTPSQIQGKMQNTVGSFSISTGLYHTAGVCADGSVVACGDNDKGQCDVNGWHNVVAIATGLYHTVGVCADGSVVACGDNDKGQCDVNGWHNVVAISTGHYHTIGLCADGSVVACGGGIEEDECDDEYDGNCIEECAVNDWCNVVAISAGHYHTVGLCENGSVVACGYVDIEDDEWDDECDVNGWHNVMAISAGYYYTIGLCADGSVVACGDRKNGQ